MNTLPLLLATAHAPLFGNQWLALLAVLADIAVLIAAVAFIGRWLAATHPTPTPPPAPAPVTVIPAIPEGISPEILAVIAAAVAAQLGSRARIAAVQAPSVEMLMQQWSLEGRRQIYSSHQLR